MRRTATTVFLLALLAAGCGSDDRSAAPQGAADPPGPQQTTALPSSPPQTASTPPGPPGPPGPPAPPAPLPPPPPQKPALRQGQPRLERVAEADAPLYVTSPPGDRRLFVVEKGGRILVVSNGRRLPTPFLDLSGQVATGSEQGLLSIAFAPDYARSGRAYVNYTDTSGDTRVIEYTVDRGNRDRLDPGSRREVLAQDQPYSNHNGGLLLFDPTGQLLVGLGDGGAGGDPQDRAQDLGTLLGKILRIDPSRREGGRPYAVPRDNPFVGRRGVRPEIWAYGLRNPWRFSFGPDGTFYLGDVGQNRFEEVDAVPRDRQSGANYGWPVFEGRSEFKSRSLNDAGRLVRPVLDYPLVNGRCAVTSGGAYTGTVAALQGQYLYGDFCSGEVYAVRIRNGRAERQQRLPFTVANLSSFGTDAAGEMYVVSLGGTVSRITA